MGVSLQVYRSRIGSFSSTSFKLPKTKSSTGQTSNLYIGKFLITLILLSALASFIHVSTQDHHVPDVPPTSAQGGAAHLAQETHNYLLDRPSRLTSRDRNFLAKIVNGNRGAMGTGIKLLHWNKGPSFLHNKHDVVPLLLAITLMYLVSQKQTLGMIMTWPLFSMQTMISTSHQLPVIQN